MKPRAWCSLFLVGGAVVGFAADTITVKIADETAPPSSTSGIPTKPSEKSPPKASEKNPAKPAAKKEEPMGKIEGLEIKRGSGYLGLQLVSGTFKLSFYDAKKKSVEADVGRAVLRWPVAYRELDERTVLNRSADGKSLTSPKIVKPPHNFKLFITLLPAETGEEAGSETFVVDFRG